jgi:hypothetical protein
MTHPDYEAGRNSAYMGHTEPNPEWCNEAFHCGWLDSMIARTPMNAHQRRNASNYRADVIRGYRGE